MVFMLTSRIRTSLPKAAASSAAPVPTTPQPSMVMMMGLHAGDVGQQLAGAAVDGLGKVQGRQEAALTGQLTHGAQQGELALLVLPILIGHGGGRGCSARVSVSSGVSVGVDVEENLVLVHPLELLGTAP